MLDHRRFAYPTPWKNSARSEALRATTGEVVTVVAHAEGAALGPGRPHASSRAVLEEAAFELFLEQGYAGTTAAQIARRAGVSRGTFFNYFASKADVFWADIDDAIDELDDRLRTSGGHGVSPSRVRAEIVGVAAAMGADRVPWILTQFEAIGSPAEVRSSAAERVSRAAMVIDRALLDRAPKGVPVAAASALASHAIAQGLLGCVLAAMWEWANQGVQREPLSVVVERAFTALAGSFR